MAVVEIARGTSASNGTTVTATVGDLPAALTAGHLVAFLGKNDDAPGHIFSDTDGLTWTTHEEHNHGINVGAAVGSAKIDGGVNIDDGHVFTCTLTSTSRKALIVYHVDDLNTTAWVDEIGQNNESAQTVVDATLQAATDEANTLVMMGGCIVSDGALGWTPDGDDGDVVDVSNRSLVTSWHSETAAGTHSESGTADASGNFAAVIVAFIKAAGGGTTLTPDGLVHSRAVGAVTVSPQLRPAGLVHSRAVGAADLDVTAAPDGLVHSRAVGAVQVNVTVTPAGLVHSRSVGATVVSAGGVLLLPDGLTHGRAVGSPIVHPQARPAAVVHSRELGAPAANPRLFVTGLTHTRAVGAPAIALGVNPAGLVHSRAVGSPTVGSRFQVAGLVHSRALGATSVPGAPAAPSADVSTRFPHTLL